jgi:putative ABC transport system substrate-binding protein
MRRRQFIRLLGGAATTWPLAASAQRTTPVIGILHQRPAGSPGLLIDAFRQGLRDNGYIEGRNIIVRERQAERHDLLSPLAAELVSEKVDVIVASGSEAVRAAQEATRSIPIVMTSSSDPIGTGFVASLARPGGNITGLSLQSTEVSGGRLQLLKEIVPGLSVVAILWNPDDPPAALPLKETQVAAAALDLSAHAVQVHSPDEFEAAFASITDLHPQALVCLSAPLMSIHAERIAGWAVKSRLPAMQNYKEFPRAGGLMSYGPSLVDLYRRAAVYVDKILKGARPADLPVEQPTKFEFVVNLTTAKALGLTVPDKLLAIADELSNRAEAREITAAIAGAADQNGLQQRRLKWGLHDPMYGPAVRGKRFSSIWLMRSCINVSGL